MYGDVSDCVYLSQSTERTKKTKKTHTHILIVRVGKLHIFGTINIGQVMAKLSIWVDSLHIESFEHLHLRQQSPLYFVSCV